MYQYDRNQTLMVSAVNYRAIHPTKRPFDKIFVKWLLCFSCLGFLYEKVKELY